VGTEHILLGLLRDEDGAAADTLRGAGVTHVQVRAAVVRMMGTGVAPEPGAGEPAFTGRAQEAVDRARREAAHAGAELAGTEHILLALIGERDGAAVRILQQLDTDVAAIRSALAS
jgi:ATP-dependent Clp protease ATP-binding subunit ClpC